MGRELKRKEAKKNKKPISKKVEEENYKIKGSTILKLVISSILILLVLYYIIAVFITKEIDVSWGSNNQQSETTNELENKILATNTFNQQEETYYVYFYNFNEEDTNITRAVKTLRETVYKVNTNDALNKNYVTEENGNRNATSISDLKVKSPTLIKIEADKITAYYEGNNEIISNIK